MRSNMATLYERTDILANITGAGTSKSTPPTTIESGYGSSKIESEVSRIHTSGTLNYGVMAQDLRAKVIAKDCKHFKARDYHQLDSLLDVFDSIGYLPDQTVSKTGWEKALRFFEERDLVDNANYIPQRDPIVVVSNRPAPAALTALTGRPPARAGGQRNKFYR
ncbi:hypothetical protein BpHYR1_007779 [Brachionus plicatilis]|uniref:Uncharacterized protein n=1 Tax=Brachionus plicatilis TaxID=10195 RepID=A0A3M7SYB6_BRAPC|nr:hypothetical protein BpHYR1_007779 [Brachionus plicatilis]